MSMSHKEALEELLRVHKIENKIKTIQSITANKLLDIK